MCGIAGIMTRDGRPPDAHALDRLERALRHRGPDGTGRHVRAGIGLVHTRLAVIDLETGDQPISLGSGNGPGAVLVANGEIYNYVELRAELGKRRFHTKSDCEPPLALYLGTGTGFAERLRGMYAIAIDDRTRNRLVLARDPFGIKPLYFVETVEGLAFASEPQALVMAGLVRPAIERRRLAELMQLQFTTGAGTIFRGVQRVLPGETLVVQDGRVALRWRQSALPEDGPANWREADAMQNLNRALMDSVAVHQRSDVPYGMFLSGGVDSSAVLACMRDLNDRPVRAYSAGFSGSGATDERDHARTVAAAAGAVFVDIDFSEDDFWRLLPEIAAAMDDPAADYAVLPTYKLGAKAKADGIKVVLTGEGGDELFAGYGRYRRMLRPRLFGGREMRAEGPFDGLGILRPHPPAGVWRSGMEAAAKDAVLKGRTRLQIAQATDCADWLPNDLLIKLDRCLMAHGVEGRTPFLDPRVAEVAFRLPDKLKVRNKLGKWLLREWLDDKLPEARAFDAKRGFTVPVGEWIAKRGSVLGSLVARQPGIEEACAPDAVKRLFSRGAQQHGQAAWRLLFYALWHSRHVQGRDPKGDVMETLSAEI
jgi:asparagine synthase (glutamine-hydrolysing)